MTCSTKYPLCPDCGKEFLPNPNVKDGEKRCNICRFYGEVAAKEFKRLSKCY